MLNLGARFTEQQRITEYVGYSQETADKSMYTLLIQIKKHTNQLPKKILSKEIEME